MLPWHGLRIISFLSKVVIVMRRTILFVVALLLLAVTVRSQTVTGTRVNTQTGYDIYRDSSLIERHTLTATGESIILSPFAPVFTGQWTVNGSLCAAGQVVQGGSPTTCTATPTVTSVTLTDAGQVLAKQTTNALGVTAKRVSFLETGYTNGQSSPFATMWGTFYANNWGSDDGMTVEGRAAAAGSPANPALEVSGRAFDATTYAAVQISGTIAAGSGGGYNLQAVGPTSKVFSICNQNGTAACHYLQWYMLGSGATTQRVESGLDGNPIGAAFVAGSSVINLTAATSLAPVQWSPASVLCGAAWKTDATTGSQTDCWDTVVKPVSQAGLTASTLSFGASINSGTSFTEKMSLTSGGLLTTTSLSTGAATTSSLSTSSLSLAALAFSSTAPTIASGGCTSPAVTWSNGTSSFLLTIGSSCTGVKTITLTLPAAAHFWQISCDNNTSDARQQASMLVNRATSTTAVVLTHYARVTGLQGDFTAADTFLCSAHGG